MTKLKKVQDLGELVFNSIDKMEDNLSYVTNVPWQVSKNLEEAQESMRKAMHDLVSLTSIERQEIPENERAERVDDWPHAQQRAA